MALLSTSNFFFFFSLIFFFPPYSSYFAVSLPTALLIPITKGLSTLQYTTIIKQRTPLKPTKLVLDLGASFNWVNCQKNYQSSTYKPIFCNSSLCASLKSLACSNCYEPPRPGCANDSCALFPENSVTRDSTIGDALIDAIALPTTDGYNPGRLVLISDFVFSCSRTFLLKGLAKGVAGVAALGRSNFSLPAQISTTFSSQYLFALCLSGSSSSTGVAFLGTAGPYVFLPQQVDLSKSLIYTSLILNPVSDTVITYYGQPSDEYFIGVTAVKVNGKAVQLNETLLAIDDETGFGGTKMSTVVPYTTMESSIYEVFTEAFISEAAALNLTVIKPVKPFNVCFPVDEVGSTRVGPAVPTVDLVMEQKENVFWRIFGANSMVKLGEEGEEMWCLAFVDSGRNPRTSILIGAHQMEDNLLQFDVGSKRLGFSSSLLLKQTTCSNFNFTSSSSSSNNR
ncbi:probable aspartic proteinase GIP1 [Telopea speciosissima]|uniref:probable aspartic proteinase GIP1 n=1 Tax=Telopea speciosissima TaxID=54955 RepID=UPI001CC71690|nr:probable aspartic proteinase GIP1 [Telopea speciosissima]